VAALGSGAPLDINTTGIIIWLVIYCVYSPGFWTGPTLRMSVELCVGGGHLSVAL